ncbi:MAG TPA: polyprenyl diphosphate synthase [Methanocorpusculum sp.]|nr:polyprenyl diphosphate synthase [Methanocorpusculum sp.]
MSLRSIAEDVYSQHLLAGLKHIPNHIAVIQDGNRRYAKAHDISTAEGHRVGADTTLKVIDWMGQIGIKHVTLYAFSTENFQRSSDEVTALMQLFIEKFTDMLSDKRISDKKINVSVIGDRSLIPASVLSSIEKIENATKKNDNYFIHIAIAYGGRNEITEAARHIICDVREGKLSADEITAGCITNAMYPEHDMPPVDLIIRTANDRRTSNFLPWLANGNEAAVCFCSPTWPEFRYVDLIRALRVYDERFK